MFNVTNQLDPCVQSTRYDHRVTCNLSNATPTQSTLAMNTWLSRRCEIVSQIFGYNLRTRLVLALYGREFFGLIFFKSQSIDSALIDFTYSKYSPVTKGKTPSRQLTSPVTKLALIYPDKLPFSAPRFFHGVCLSPGLTKASGEAVKAF